MRKLLALTTFFMLLGVITGFCEKPVFAESEWKLGTEIYSFTYKEPGVMKEEGIMRGISASYTNTSYNKNMFRGEIRCSFGEVDYENSGTVNDIDDYVWELRLLGGKSFSVFTETSLSPHIGVGFRYLNDDMAGKISSTGAHGYERESNYFYMPIGIEIITSLEKSWSFSAILEYDYFISGKQKSHLSDVDPGYNDLENDQESGYGLRASVAFEKKNKNLNLLIEPFIRYWNIKKSKNADITYYGTYRGYGWEPKNNSKEIGIMVSLKF